MSKKDLLEAIIAGALGFIAIWAFIFIIIIALGGEP